VARNLGREVTVGETRTLHRKRRRAREVATEPCERRYAHSVNEYSLLTGVRALIVRHRWHALAFVVAVAVFTASGQWTLLGLQLVVAIAALGVFHLASLSRARREGVIDEETLRSKMRLVLIAAIPVDAVLLLLALRLFNVRVPL
jgi:hypothetical protein